MTSLAKKVRELQQEIDKPNRRTSRRVPLIGPGGWSHLPACFVTAHYMKLMRGADVKTMTGLVVCAHRKQWGTKACYIARRTGQEEGTVSRSLRRLEKLGIAIRSGERQWFPAAPLPSAEERKEREEDHKPLPNHKSRAQDAVAQAQAKLAPAQESIRVEDKRVFTGGVQPSGNSPMDPELARLARERRAGRPAQKNPLRGAQ